MTNFSSFKEYSKYNQINSLG